MQAICAPMRKYLTALWVWMYSGEDFDTAKLFSEKICKKLDGEQSVDNGRNHSLMVN